MKKTAKFLTLLLACAVCAACGKKAGATPENDITDFSAGNGVPQTAGEYVAKHAYFLDDDTLFLAQVPQGWICSPTGKPEFICLDSVVESTWSGESNAFFVSVEAADPERTYAGDGEKSGVRVSPDGDYLIHCSTPYEQTLTAAQYERNKDVLETFYQSVHYQKGTKQIGQAADGEPDWKNRIKLHVLVKKFMGLSVVLPEGIVCEKEFVYDEKDGHCDVHFRFFLDESGENFVELYSDTARKEYSNVFYSYNLCYDMTEDGEVVGFRDEKNGDMVERVYAFAYQKAGARISVKKGEDALFDLAFHILKSVTFAPEESWK